MDIYEMLHKTTWFGIAAEMLANPDVNITVYKADVYGSRNEFPECSCVFCEVHENCRDCPLAIADFACSSGWYSKMLNNHTPLYKRFYYAVRCACVDMEMTENWLLDGIECVIKLLRLKTLCEEIEALNRLHMIVYPYILLDIDRRDYLYHIIQARLAELD